jgi:hypothetical protein
LSEPIGCLVGVNGALLDAELLAAAYVELTTTRQAALQLEPITLAPVIQLPIAKTRRRPLPPRVSAADRAERRAFMSWSPKTGTGG